MLVPVTLTPETTAVILGKPFFSVTVNFGTGDAYPRNKMSIVASNSNNLGKTQFLEKSVIFFFFGGGEGYIVFHQVDLFWQCKELVEVSEALLLGEK